MTVFYIKKSLRAQFENKETTVSETVVSLGNHIFHYDMIFAFVTFVRGLLPLEYKKKASRNARLTNMFTKSIGLIKPNREFVLCEKRAA